MHTQISVPFQWDFICDSAYIPKLTASVYFAALLVGAMLGSLSDYFGRKRVIMVAWVGLSVFQASLGLARTFPVYIVLRAIAGIFAGTCIFTSCYDVPVVRGKIFVQ